MEEKKFSAIIESLTDIQDFLTLKLDSNNIDMKISTKIAVCTDEIVSNIVYYSESEYILVNYDNSDNAVTITFTDNGKAFNPLVDSMEPDITAKAEERKIGGLGIFMVKKMTDSIKYNRESDCNVLTISFNCNSL
ncbi:MAG: ATP-binding protein [Treponema sp.]|nr:ATP-binding protein [Treponema sp.]